MQSNAVAAEAIRHVVVLMLENHSFDQMLGCFKQVYPELEGVDPGAGRHNQDTAGRIYPRLRRLSGLCFLTLTTRSNTSRRSLQMETVASSKILKAPSAPAVPRREVL